MKMKCKVCDVESNHQEYSAKEMMFGLKENFNYFQCNNCNCLQIAEFPADMTKYYPDNYYSYSLSSKKKMVDRLKIERDKHVLFNKGIIGGLVNKVQPAIDTQILTEIPLTKTSKILDVGCGSGDLLFRLKSLGFNNVLGIDPFLEKDLEYDNGLKVLKKSIHEIDSKWDVIMFHHSFEHIPDPKETLAAVSKLLADGGYCIIRVPTVSSYAWEHYKENWVQFDAPRHFFLHSKESMRFLTEKAGLNLEKTVFDSKGFQFWGSEQYLKDIPLRSDTSYDVNPKKSIFSKKEIKEFSEKSLQLNAEGKGDQCAFIIREVNYRFFSIVYF